MFFFLFCAFRGGEMGLQLEFIYENAECLVP